MTETETKTGAKVHVNPFTGEQHDAPTTVTGTNDTEKAPVDVPTVAYDKATYEAAQAGDETAAKKIHEVALEHATKHGYA